MSAPVRLADLPPAGRRIVLALLAAEAAAVNHKVGAAALPPADGQSSVSTAPDPGTTPGPARRRSGTEAA